MTDQMPAKTAAQADQNFAQSRSTDSRSTGANGYSSLSEHHTISLKINGQAQTLSLLAWTTLLDLLRENIGLTGTKKGCDHGQCGACTVLVDGKRINACLTLAVMMDGAEITTIEGLAQGEALHPIQAAFVEHDAFQCGYCTPGQICSAVGLLQEQAGKQLNDQELREQMSGNLCRCGAYSNILDAVREVMQGSQTAPEAVQEAV